MIKVYGFTPSNGLPDLSPFVLKVATYLRMIGVPYELLGGNARKAPKKKLPYIDDGGEILADSTLILQYLQKKYKDLDVGLDPQSAALGEAFRALFEEKLYFAMLVLRWQDDTGWAHLLPNLVGYMKKSGVPGFLAPIIANQVRKNVLQTAYAQGMGRHAIPEVEAIGVAALDAIATFLGDKPYFLGEKPRTLDATVHAFLWTLSAAAVEKAPSARFRAHANLVRYVERMQTQYWQPR